MASTPPYKNVVKNGNFYHVYPGHKFRFIRKAGGKANHTGGAKAPTDPMSAQYDALLSALGLGSSKDNADLITSAKAMAGLKLDPQIQAIDQATQKAAGAKEYLSQRMAKYQTMYQNSVNQGASAARAANTPAALGMSTGNAQLDQALLAQQTAQRQGAANQAGTIAQVAGMRGQDQQNQLSQEFQSQFNDLQQKRLGVEQQRAGETLNALTGLADQKQKAAADEADRQMAADALGLKIDQAEEDVRHNKVTERNKHRSDTLNFKTNQNKLSSQEKREQAKLEQSAREGRLNREQKDRLAQLKTKSGLGQKDQNTASSQVGRLKSFAAKAKHGDPFVSGHGRQRPLDRHKAAQKLIDNSSGLMDQSLISAALDAVYNGRMSNTTARKLKAAGIDPKRIASALGVSIGAGSGAKGYSKGGGRPD